MQSERTEKRREFIINAVYFFIVAFLAYVVIRYFSRWLMPFVIGFFIALSTRPAVNGFCRLTRINRKIGAVIVLLLEYAVLIVLLWALGSKIFDSLKSLSSNLPAYYDNSILPLLGSLTKYLEELASKISPQTLSQIYSMLESAQDSIRGFVVSLSTGILSFLADSTKKIPFFLISFVFTILASVFISMDYRGILNFIKKQLPPRVAEVVSDAKRQIGKTVLKYLRAYIIIFCITFVELAVGLSVLKIENPLGLAALIAVADILPVLGTGTVLIPWAIWGLLVQNYFLAVGLVALYVIILVVRNFAEPKIVGDQLGLNPIVTLIAIYTGYRLFGVGGMIGLPILTTILVGLHKAGKIKLWKD